MMSNLSLNIDISTQICCDALRKRPNFSLLALGGVVTNLTIFPSFVFHSFSRGGGGKVNDANFLQFFFILKDPHISLVALIL